MAKGAAPQTTQSQTPQASQSPPGDLTQVSIENLMNMEISSASKKEQSVSRTAAAVFVLTQEDIRRSGMTALPDVSRLAFRTVRYSSWEREKISHRTAG